MLLLLWMQLVINAFSVNAAEIAAVHGRQLRVGLFHYGLQGSEAHAEYCLVVSDGLDLGG